MCVCHLHINALIVHQARLSQKFKKKTEIQKFEVNNQLMNFHFLRINVSFVSLICSRITSFTTLILFMFAQSFPANVLFAIVE